MFAYKQFSDNWEFLTLNIRNSVNHYTGSLTSTMHKSVFVTTVCLLVHRSCLHRITLNLVARSVQIFLDGYIMRLSPCD